MKRISTRIAQKHDLEAVWIQNNPDFIPMAGEIIIFDAEVDNSGNTLMLPQGRTQPYTFSRTKVGDGFTDVLTLPFCSSVVQIVNWEDND